MLIADLRGIVLLSDYLEGQMMESVVVEAGRQRRGKREEGRQDGEETEQRVGKRGQYFRNLREH